LLGTGDGLFVLLAVRAAFAVALVGAHAARGEAFAVHLQALGLLARAAALLFFDCSGRTDFFLW
jgi:hypothetical protein